MVVIKSCCTITPAEPTFDGPFPLSDIDQSKVKSLSPAIYAYRGNNNNNNTLSLSFSQVVETLKVSLSRALVPFYPLAGRLRWIGGGRLELVCNAMGAEFVVAESDSTLEEFGDFDPTDKIKPLLPLIDYAIPIEELPVMSVRVTRFACGGITIGLAISHILVDDVSATQFIGSWSKLARGEALDESDVPLHDRSVLMNTSSSPPPQHLDIPVQWKPLPLIMGRADTAEEQEKETTVALLKLTKEQIEGLHKQANANYEILEKEIKTRPCTQFESIAAHIWRIACKARGHEHEQPTVCVVVDDCRRRAMIPPIPKGYFGNAMLHTTTDPSIVSGELVSKPLGYAASKVREGVCKITDSYMKTTLGLIASQEDVTWLRSGIRVAGSKKGRFLGNPNVMVTRMIGLPIHGADFGWGKPSYVGPGALFSDGRCYITTGCDEDGSLVVAIRFQAASMPLFRKLFYQDIID